MINLAIINGNATLGGAIYSTGLLGIYNVTFINNTAGRGGAIWASNPYNSTMANIIQNSVFINNHGTDSSAGGGGALMLTGGQVQISYSNFINNTASNNGGAINKNNGTIIGIFESVFENNSANNGGAIYNTNSNLTISDSLFNNNSANAGNGGAVYSNTATSTFLYYVNFYRNSANGQGGAIYVRHSINSTGSNYINNTASQGGGIYSIPDTGDVSVQYNRFVNNSNYDYYLNNTGMSKTPNLSYNWWGNNTPLVYGIVLTDWFVMQLTANNFSTIVNSSTNQPGSNVNLSYQLILYNNTTNTFSVVDYGNLPDFIVNLTWTGINGINSELINAKGFYSEITNFTSGSGFSLRAIGDNENLMLYKEIIFANLTISKTANVTNVLNGQRVTYTITVTNNGNNTATNVWINDILPSGIIYLGSYPSGDYNPSTGIWYIGNLNNGSNVTLFINVLLNRSGNITNMATINLDEFNLGINNTNVTISVDPAVNLTINKSSNVKGNVVNGQTIHYTITVSNHGPDGARNVVVNDKLPLELVYLGSSTKYGTYNPNTGIWTIGSLAKDGTATLIITVRINTTGNITNIVNITTSDMNYGSNMTNLTILAIHNTSLNVSAKFSNDNKTIFFTGKLVDEFGNPLSNKTIKFYLNGKYIGKSLTNENGVAELNYTKNNPFKPANYLIFALFNGDEEYNYSNASYNLKFKEDKNNSTNNTNINPVVANATMKETGIPITAIFLVFLISLGLITKKR